MTDPLLIVLIGMLVVVGCIIVLRLHAFVALIIAAFTVALITPRSALERFAEASLSAAQASRLLDSSIGQRIAVAFGENAAEIGIIIGMAAIIGKCLLESGAAERIVRSVLRVTGAERSPIAFTGSSFFLAIPVFFDTVFFLMIPLAKAMAMRIGKHYLLLVLAVAGGAAMAHSLVPPTPGPLFLVAAMDIPMHLMMIGGLAVGVFTVTSGYFYARWADRKWDIPLRGSGDAPLDEIAASTQRDTTELPALWLSTLPILVPLVFISLTGFLGTFTDAEATSPAISALIGAGMFIGEKNTALVIGGLIALVILAGKKGRSREEVSESMQSAVKSGGVIILITAAGGAFGEMLQQTGVSSRIADLTSGYQMALIPLAFLITATVRTAQGSATVSMITAAGILSGMASNGDLGYHILYLGLAVACGSKVFSWMNDSGFWIVSTMSNFEEEETLKTFSVMLTVMGCVGVVVVMIAAWLFPLV